MTASVQCLPFPDNPPAPSFLAQKITQAIDVTPRPCTVFSIRFIGAINTLETRVLPTTRYFPVTSVTGVKNWRTFEKLCNVVTWTPADEPCRQTDPRTQRESRDAIETIPSFVAPAMMTSGTPFDI